MDIQELERKVGDYCAGCEYETCCACMDCELSKFIAWVKAEKKEEKLC
jgi:hypothetical protein